MAQADRAPTKTNLLRLRSELKFAEQGYELLDQKRNILIVELLAMVDQTADHQERVDRALAQAYHTLEEAILDMGRLKMQYLTGAVNIATEITVRSRRVMGVNLPVVETQFTDRSPYYSPMGTSFWIDGSIRSFKEVLRLLGKLAELKISLLRLANEVKRTIRKVNALEKIAIPDLREAVCGIEGRLEENERDMFTLMKMVKQNLDRKRQKAREADRA
ncbi:MAG TPA: V-type ATP synthase subunit D [Sedimentisphaerales bacterium]|jgi:V/A-type H+-transporting ATPase subunit D|nr:V-type ATP synthase subunit D [Sedimentisphaerales bacterium]HNU28126.1 V-type ATP synthase subunit D [Sedimentisphaerales bacterium]